MTVSAETNDETLARLLADLSEKQRRGEATDIESIVAANPNVADELRQLWGMAQVAEELARRRPVRIARKAILPKPPLTGQPFGDFELIQEIGRGGMGVVYKAWQSSLKRVVALKMVLRGVHATEADLARFQVEVQATAHLEHPNIVPVYAAGQHEGQAYFCMRLVEGQTLAAFLARGPLRARDAANILATIAHAIQFAHERGILHRDLKPSNILLDSDGRPHVTDFGLAKRVSGDPDAEGTALTQSNAILGTPAYMAPEMVTNRRGLPSAASDVYSLGVILYEMLTGRPPFQSPTPVNTMLLVLDQDPIRPAALNPKVDPDLELICLKCIQKEPELRYQTAAALASDLEAYLRGDTLSLRRTSLADLGNFFSRIFRETHHAVVLENWGLLWMCHALMVFSQCVITTLLAWNVFTNPLWYLGLWGGGLLAWSVVFWNLRKRAGPVLFIERQVAHVWAGAILATIGVFVLEILLDVHVLKFAPMLAVIAGMTFVAKAGMLSGALYIAAAAEFLTAVPMALFPDYGILLFGLITAICFLVPGYKYHRQRQRTLARQQESKDSSTTNS
ncbi:MAG: serine/threonine protein kinase [Planctomycetia bacterium]|nr:serine/threonine protein kinase [Planctomycetia bacterium]